jgi:hypothetical protein
MRPYRDPDFVRVDESVSNSYEKLLAIQETETERNSLETHSFGIHRSCLVRVCVGQPLNRPIRSLYHTVWKARDGVPNDIVAIQQTRDGYLWLGTGEGLFRFDGVRFERYEPNRGGALFSGRISALLATKDGGLWIAHQGRGVRASFLKNGEVRKLRKS